MSTLLCRLLKHTQCLLPWPSSRQRSYCIFLYTLNVQSALSERYNNSAVRLLFPLLTHASPTSDKHNSLSHSAMGEPGFDLCWGQRSKLYMQVALGDPQSSHPQLLCLCLCLCSPRVLAGPWEEPGTHRHWLVVSNASTNSRFHGSQGGGRVRALRPAGASWVPAPTPRDLIVPLVAPPQAATWEGSHFIVTPWHQNVTSNSKVQRLCARQMSPPMDRVSERGEGSPAAGVEMQGQGHCNSQTSISLTLCVPFPPLRCLFSGRPVEKCFEKNETDWLNSIAMHDDSIVWVISFRGFSMCRSIYPNIESFNGIKYNEIFMVLGCTVVKGFEYIIQGTKMILWTLNELWCRNFWVFGPSGNLFFILKTVKLHKYLIF